MPLNTNLNVAPFFDDYNANNEYYRVLFRPGVAVQARELTQVQSILQNQFENFGNWAFKNGDIVSGCSITDDPQLDFVRLNDYVNGTTTTPDLTTWANLYVRSVSSNLTAGILFANNGQSTNYPNTNTLYLKYKNTSTGGNKVFTNNETLQIIYPSNGAVVATINSYSNSTAGQNTVDQAHGIHVDAGIVYLNGVFVNVLTPTYGIVNAHGTYAANNLVGFQLSESVVGENQDTTLLDNSLGYPNQNAPGAWRLKLTPTLVSIDPTTANTAGFNPITSYNYGRIVNKNQSSANLYSIVGDAIAQKVYDEAGNYVINPFIVDTVTSTTGDSIINAPNANSMIGRINPGRGYAQGYPVGYDITQYVNPLRRGIDLQTNLQQNITFSYGNYFVLNEVAGSFDFTKAQTVTLYDQPQQAITNRYFNTLTPTGNAIGTAYARCFSYNNGVQGSNTATYLLHVFNVVMNTGKNVNQVKSVYYSSGSTKGVGDLYSPFKAGSNAKQLYNFGYRGLVNLRDSSNNIHTEYIYRNKISATMNTSGDLTYTISGGGSGGTNIDQLPYGIGTLSDLDAASFNLIATATVDSSALTGTVGISSTTTTVTGSGGTSFNTQFNLYDTIKITNSSATMIRTVVSVSGASSMVVDAPFGVTETGDTYYKTYRSGKIIPIQQNTTGPQSNVQVTNSTSFSINTQEIPSSSLSVDVVFDVQRTVASPATKAIKKRRFVKLNIANNAAGPKGPWCLGFSDIHQVRNVYGSLDGTYSANNADITNLFTYDTGQKDTHYDLGYLYPTSGFDATVANTLLVELDYFLPNTSPGVGFFTVESYPIDDTNTANNNAIRTMDVPLYVDTGGFKNTLRDFLDFRTPSAIAAADTGNLTYDSNNNPTSASITTAVSSATVNPANTLTLSVPTAGLNVPSYGKNLQTDYTFYLARKDLVYITPDNNLHIKEGVSSTSPQDPLFPDNSMALAVLNIPPYPSLTSDQVDQLYPVNQLSTTLIRDTSLSVSTKSVTNRRYTMKDIGTLDHRVTNLEYYVSLSTLEQKTTAMTITDANGLNRFKNGIFADPMNDFVNSDVSNPEWALALDRKEAIGRPSITREVVNIDFDTISSSNVTKTGTAITLPYTEKSHLPQPFSTGIRSAAHVSQAWNGSCIIIPPLDNHEDIKNTGSINITVDTSSPWENFAKSPFNSVYGDWRTTQVMTEKVVTEGAVDNKIVDVGNLGLFVDWTRDNQGRLVSAGSQATALARLQAQFPNVQWGNISYNITYVSDVRLKRNISFIGKLINGLNVYKYRYLWSDIFYVGVMAQEVQKIIPDAVVYGADGYMKVNYGKVGVPFLTWNQFQNINNFAV
jgi:hypothetical protein